MRSSSRIPPHRPTLDFDPRDETTEEDKFIGRPCYVFNSALRSNLNDTRCSHCRHYLTARCPHIDEFLDDVEELMPE